MSTRVAKDTLWNAMGDFQHNGEEVKVSVKPVMDLHLCLDRLSGFGIFTGGCFDGKNTVDPQSSPWVARLKLRSNLRMIWRYCHFRKPPNHDQCIHWLWCFQASQLKVRCHHEYLRTLQHHEREPDPDVSIHARNVFRPTKQHNNTTGVYWMTQFHAISRGYICVSSISWPNSTNDPVDGFHQLGLVFLNWVHPWWKDVSMMLNPGVLVHYFQTNP